MADAKHTDSLSIAKETGQNEMPAPVQKGERPGHLWWIDGNQWVPEAESWEPNNRSYALIGPLSQTAV